MSGFYFEVGYFIEVLSGASYAEEVERSRHAARCSAKRRAE